jgi:hypothetical protein
VRDRHAAGIKRKSALNSIDVADGSWSYKCRQVRQHYNVVQTVTVHESYGPGRTPTVSVGVGYLVTIAPIDETMLSIGHLIIR